MYLCASPGFRCAENKKKNHERNSCNKNQSVRREKAPGAGRRLVGDSAAAGRNTLPNSMILKVIYRDAAINGGFVFE